MIMGRALLVVMAKREVSSCGIEEGSPCGNEKGSSC